jgi:hypothetical protein
VIVGLLLRLIIQNEKKPNMALKKNTVTLLSWLYPVSEPRWLATEDLAYLLPELSPSGQRSLVALLLKENLLEKVPFELISDSLDWHTKTKFSQVLRATEYAKVALRAQFSSFRFFEEPWQGQWSIISFLDSPKSDPQFRYLRTRLLAHNAGQLRAGTYLYPGELPAELLHQLTQLYVGSVVVWQTKNWRFGDERHIVGSLFGLQDTAQSFSSISSQLSGLLTNSNNKKSLTVKQKIHLFAVFNRWVATMEDCAGIYSWYYPQVKTPEKLLQEFHTVYSI